MINLEKPSPAFIGAAVVLLVVLYLITGNLECIECVA